MPRTHHRHDPVAGRFMHEIFGPLREGFAAVRRGKVRPLILAVLHDRPMHGYQVIQELEARTGGRWRPSAGTIYPTLQLLEDEGMVRTEEADGRKVYVLTDAGREEAEASPLTRHPWFEKDAGGVAVDMRKLAVMLVGAAIQVQRAGSPDAQREARRILVESRRRLYRLLADDEAAAEEPAS
jgi:DNA-binding PadR family transcriptional regulator